MNLQENYYPKDYPDKGEIVYVVMEDPENDMVNATILEYPKLNGLFQLYDLTRKKRIKSIRTFIHKKPVPAEVIEIDTNTNIISLSRKFIKNDELNDLDNQFKQRVKILNLARTFGKLFKFENWLKEIHYPIISNFSSKYYFEELKEKYQTFNFLPKEFINFLSKTFQEKDKKLVSKFSVVATKDINDTISLFTEIKTLFPKIKPKLISTPQFYIETTGKNEEEIHQEYLNTLKQLAPKYQVKISC